VSETLDLVATTDLDHRQLAEQLLAQAKQQGVDLVGPNMTEHLGYDKHDPAGRGSGNSRNGVRTKTTYVITSARCRQLDPSRDRFQSAWSPMSARYGRNLDDFTDTVDRGLTSAGLHTDLHRPEHMASRRINAGQHLTPSLRVSPRVLPGVRGSSLRRGTSRPTRQW
jgi:putative transposase